MIRSGYGAQCIIAIGRAHIGIIVVAELDDRRVIARLERCIGLEYVRIGVRVNGTSSGHHRHLQLVVLFLRLFDLEARLLRSSLAVRIVHVHVWLFFGRLAVDRQWSLLGVVREETRCFRPRADLELILCIVIAVEIDHFDCWTRHRAVGTRHGRIEGVFELVCVRET